MGRRGWAAPSNRFRMACAALLAGLGVGALAPAAPAQGLDGPATPYVDAVTPWANSQTLRRLLPDEGGTGTNHPAKPPTARQLASLRFQRRADVTRRNYATVIENFGDGYDPAAIAAELTRVQARQREIVRKQFGWNPNDLGDVVTVAVLVGYSVVRDDTSIPGRATRAVRLDARRSLASDRRVRGLSGARKQTAAEMLELRLTFLLFDYNHARNAGDVAGEGAAKEEVRDFIEEVFRIDLDRVKLTRRGLVPR